MKPYRDDKDLRRALSRPEFSDFAGNTNVITHFMSVIACPLCGLMFDIENDKKQIVTPYDAIDHVHERFENNHWKGPYRGRLCVRCNLMEGQVKDMEYSKMVLNYLYNERLAMNPNLYQDLVAYRGYEAPQDMQLD